jgi:gliding motility-associated-like protein
MKRYFIVLITSVLTIFCSVAQNQNLTVTHLMNVPVDTILQQHLQGQGVIISGFPGYEFFYDGEVHHGKFNGQNTVTYDQIGVFNRNGFTAFPFETGLVMTTGNVSVAAGPNNSGSASQEISPHYQAPWLLNYTTGTSVTSAAELKFDFIAMADTFAFNYIFASEEYCEYSNSPSVNDVFAFILEGIDPYTLQNTTKNVAIVPNSITATNPNGTPVSIGTVNHGTHSGGVATNPEYFYCNANNVNGIQYDGYTRIQNDGYNTGFSASAAIFACQTYHMKLGISNVGDKAYDSGVFIEEGSFYSPHVKVSQDWETDEGGDTLVQNCRDLDLTFKIEHPMLTSSTSIIINTGGDALMGTDYILTKPNGMQLTPDDPVFFYPEGDTVQLVHVNMAPTATFPEGVDTKTIILYVVTQGCSGNGNLQPYFYVEDTITLHLRANDSIRLRDTAITVCERLDYIEVELDRGTAPTFYQWYSATGDPNPAGITDPESPATACNITESAVYKLVATDRWSCMTDTTTVQVNIIPKPEFTVTYTPDHGCMPLMVTMQTQYTPDYATPYWTITNNEEYLYEDSTHSTLPLLLPDPGYYDISLLMESAPGCVDSLKYNNVIHVADYPHADFIFSPSEPSNGEEVFFYNQSTGENITNYVWNFGDGHSSYVEEPSHTYHLTESELMPVRLTVTNSDGCTSDTLQFVPVEDNFAFFVPSAFTPNTDGHNEIFLPKVNDVVNYELTIYNRNGELIFYTNNPEIGWDGTVAGKPAPEGIYVWRIHYAKIGTPDEMMMKTGSLTLIR